MHFDTQTKRIVLPARQTDAVAINVYVSYDGNPDGYRTRTRSNDLLAFLERKKPSTGSQQNDWAK